MITAIVQARMRSTRLPRKILTDIAGKALLGHVLERISFSKTISQVLVATTESPHDDILVKWLEENQVNYFRGSESDVLNRYFEAASHVNAAHIARITSDDPFKDPQLIDRVADLYFNGALDFAYNNKPPSFAEGLDTEIFSFEALARAERSSKDPFEREHVTQHFYRNPSLFKQENLKSDFDFSNLRWTIDTEKDLSMARKVYEELYKPGSVFVYRDILELIKRKPEIALINQDVKRSDMYKK